MEYSIPIPASKIMERVAPALLQLCPRENLTLGGGTALAARWNHRRSTDIDLFMAYEDFQKISDSLATALTGSSGILTWEDGQGWCRVSCAEGEFAIATSQSVLKPTSKARPTDVSAVWGVRLEAVDEILAKKLRLRIYGNGEFLSRDCYDLVTSAEIDPDSLTRALKVLTTRQRQEIAKELRSLRSLAKLGGRDLEAPHKPEWLPDLPLRTANLVENWPAVRPEPTMRSPRSF